MPRYPDLAERVDQVPASVFEKFRSKMKEKGPYLIRLHIGDTFMPPSYHLPIDTGFLNQRPYFNRYCNTFGVERFRRVLVDKLKEDNGFSVDVENLLVTSGATNALSASVTTLLNPGDEILVLTPCWPFFPGMVKLADAKVVEVPFYVKLYEEPELNIVKYLQSYLNRQTCAVYLNTPNNPSGKVLNHDQLSMLAQFARQNNLWIISDEAYDGLLFDNRPHISIANLSGMFRRTVSIFTFSKSFMFAGLRLGYLVGEHDVVQAINKSMVHQVYSPSTLSQYMMVEPVKQRHSWIPDLCQQYKDLRDMFCERLKVKVQSPEGTYFLFFPIDEYLNGRDYWEVIDAFLEEGVSVAPGVDFGSNFNHYIRLCFTGEPPERLEKAIERLNKVLLQ
jgi:aspartate/methionine/tyrosine aminotransferase